MNRRYYGDNLHILDMPAVTGANVTFKKAPKHKGKKQDQLDPVHDNDD